MITITMITMMIPDNKDKMMIPDNNDNMMMIPDIQESEEGRPWLRHQQQHSWGWDLGRNKIYHDRCSNQTKPTT